MLVAIYTPTEMPGVVDRILLEPRNASSGTAGGLDIM
jgi:hypothetical protein